MSWKPDEVVSICTLSKRLNVEYEIYNGANSPNRLEFRKGGRYLFEVFEENEDTIPALLSGLNNVWQSTENVPINPSFINRLILWLIGGRVVSSSQEHDVNYLKRQAESSVGSMSRQLTWTIYKLKRGSKVSVVLFKRKEALSASSLGSSSELSFNWVKLSDADMEILLPALEDFCKSEGSSLAS